MFTDEDLETILKKLRKAREESGDTDAMLMRVFIAGYNFCHTVAELQVEAAMDGMLIEMEKEYAEKEQKSRDN